ncbi:MAG: hypothetical protein ABR608_12070 [Pseudonocardiaceae bacterium]
MSRYSMTTTKAGVNTANTIMWAIKAGAAQRVQLLELGLSVEVAPTTGPAWRLNRPTAVGVSSATVAPQPEDPDVAAATAALETTWTTAPTLAAVDLRRFATPNSIGSGIVWTWYDSPLVIPKGGSIAVVNGNASGTTLGTLSMYALVAE